MTVVPLPPACQDPSCRRAATVQLDDVTHYCADHALRMGLYRRLQADGWPPESARAAVEALAEVPSRLIMEDAA